LADPGTLPWGVSANLVTDLVPRVPGPVLGTGGTQTVEAQSLSSPSKGGEADGKHRKKEAKEGLGREEGWGTVGLDRWEECGREVPEAMPHCTWRVKSVLGLSLPLARERGT
jgi:hypothetical protein